MSDAPSPPVGIVVLCGVVVLGAVAVLLEALFQVGDGGLATLNSVFLYGYAVFAVLVARGLYTLRTWAWWTVTVVGTIALLVSLFTMIRRPAEAAGSMVFAGVALAYMHSVRDRFEQSGEAGATRKSG
ncbi:hypothetical protein [Haloarchaeobius sp. DFWS5]|uniref:hypothetical protein n=1 Tax=Haloarchaeobius sp. DFWS5 TaxID=3446114 RepID=UPI003EBC11C8